VAARFELPDVIRTKAVVAGSAWWLDEVDDLVAALEDEWSIVVGDLLSGGTEALVAEAVCVDGTAAVLKILVPRAEGQELAGGLPPGASEIAVLRLADGDGCARLLRADVAREALLLERLGPSLSTLDMPTRERHKVLARLAQALWRPAPDSGLTTGAVKGRWLADRIVYLWHELDRPCAEITVDHALACCERRVAAHDDERAVLVHGDVHQWNTLQTLDGADYRLVDPDGLLAEPEYDLGVMMREDADEIWVDGPGERAHRLAALTGTDATAIWEWGVAERVSTGLLCLQVGLAAEGREMLATADRIATTEGSGPAPLGS
jgi:streptomycin 6-kinase